MAFRNDNVLVRDGLRLGYAEYGQSDGVPVFMFHGNPGSRLAWGLMPGCPFLDGVRIVAPDRPGYGLTDVRPRPIETWPSDMEALADHLGIGDFVVVGVSGGGPFALSCAWKIPERLRGVGLVSSVGPNMPPATEGIMRSLRLLWRIAGPLFPLVQLQMRIMGSMAKKDPAKIAIKLRDFELSEQDKEVFDRPEIQKIFVEDFPEAYRQNGIGSAYDALVPGHWPIPLEDVKAKVHIWNTEADQLVGKMGHYMAKRLPICEFHSVSYSGHLWVLDHIGEVLGVLLADSEGASETFQQ